MSDLLLTVVPIRAVCEISEVQIAGQLPNFPQPGYAEGFTKHTLRWKFDFNFILVVNLQGNIRITPNRICGLG